MAAIVADPNMGVGASWRAGGNPPGVAVRVVRSSPDQVVGAFDTALVQATDVLTVAVTDVPTLAVDDTFDIGADTLVVQHAERDATGSAWRVFCRR
jgi:hypothetical protein